MVRRGVVVYRGGLSGEERERGSRLEDDLKAKVVYYSSSIVYYVHIHVHIHKYQSHFTLPTAQQVKRSFS